MVQEAKIPSVLFGRLTLRTLLESRKKRRFLDDFFEDTSYSILIITQCLCCRGYSCGTVRLAALSRSSGYRSHIPKRSKKSLSFGLRRPLLSLSFLRRTYCSNRALHATGHQKKPTFWTQTSRECFFFQI